MFIEIGDKFSHYEILEKLGEGGMGVVYKARDTSLNRFVALKFLSAHLTEDESTRKRFKVEARAASALDHPNICTIHEINETADGQLYICMAYYQGTSLSQKIKQGPIPFDEAVKIFIKIARGLLRAHEEKIIHRDIKPGNILITDKGEVKIVDFGLAKLSGIELTRSTSSKGTAAYMCPEQIRGQSVDHRCDIWALGVVFYELLTGRLPFRGDYPEPVMFSIVNEEPIALSDYLSDVPEPLQALMDKVLKKDPAERYQNISELLADLQVLVRTDELAEIKTKPAIIKLLTRKKSWLYGGAAFLLVLLFIIFGRSYLFPERVMGNKIVVIPRATVTGDSDQVWFTDGITDELITNLAQISGIRVISRASAFQYKGTSKPPQQIAAELGIDYVVEAAAAKIADRVKISARLIHASEDAYIWADEYEGEFSNILGLNSEVAQAIAGKIQVELTQQEVTLLTKRRQVNPETYEKYIYGMYHLNKLTPDGIKKGLAYLQQSVEENPDEPLAQAGIAIAYLTIAHGASYTPDMFVKAKTATLNALKLDSTLAEAYLALSMVKTFYEFDWKSGMQSIKRALEINPNLALAHYFYGYLLRIPGYLEEGYAEMSLAKQLDPLNPVYATDLGAMYYLDNKFDESIKECNKSIEINPQYPHAYNILGYAYSAKGMFEEALAAQKKAGELSPDYKWGLGHYYAMVGQREKALAVISELESQSLIWHYWGIAEIYAALGDNDKTIDWLEKAYQQHHPWIQWIRRYRHFEALKNEPRFITLSQRLNLPD
jgi:serine/threonine protein kinase/tetratricopeptide (TPR) repeat protein